MSFLKPLVTFKGKETLFKSKSSHTFYEKSMLFFEKTSLFVQQLLLIPLFEKNRHFFDKVITFLSKKKSFSSPQSHVIQKTAESDFHKW